MNTAVTVILFLLLLNGIYQLTKYILIITKIKNNALFDNPKKENTVHNMISVLVPVLHEEKMLEKLLEKLSCQNYPQDCYKIYVITTQKEYCEGNSPNTIDILNHLIVENRFPKAQIYRIHFSGNQGFKTHQLDFAFDQIRKNIGDMIVSESFFLLLDADAEPDFNTLRRFNDSIENNIEIYQQPLLRFKNINLLKSPLMQSFTFLQAFFAISYEIPMFMDAFFPFRLKYCIGDGMMVKGAFLIKIGGFPDLIEDVRLGRLASFLKIKGKIVHGFGISETAKNFPTYVKQSSVWFFGCGLFIVDFLHARSLRGIKKNYVLDAIHICYGLFKAFRWLNKGLLHLLGIIFSLYQGSFALLVMFLFSLLLNSSVPVVLVSRDLRMYWARKLNPSQGNQILWNSLLFSPILYMLNFVGPYYGLFKLIRFYLCGQVMLPKTER